MTDIAAQSVADRLGRHLTTWGGASVVLGGALGIAGRSPSIRAFGVQSAGWGAIDLLIAGAGALSKKPPTTSKLRKTLWVNAGLDVGYIAAGAHVAVRKPRFGGRITVEEAAGHGVAVVVQGAALLLLDTVHARALG
ncbi:hypothetical protein GCM10007304_31460 [Rhodococcoides trifolii]|uniref:Uncharacterized protein n=1 Tax=Rhodococcoides trifolii TaxID=908250 RepID=A0A917LDQ6_9NOCA|nr:hypothetical protein [Rhodococcus trifolii]GGG15115.1 hypothetical protein GCM10007304_31460 [Rhodococcus trifolii]